VKRAAYIAVVFFALTATARSEYTIVVLEKPVRSSSLSGVVVDLSGAVIPHVTVDLVDCPVGRSYGMPTNKKLATIQTDSRGEFSFDRKGFKKPYCLHLFGIGFNPLELTVKLSRFAGKMRVKMPIGG
jgi:hypothetical protein